MKKNIKHLSLLAITFSAVLSACGASYTSSSTTSSNTSISSSESSSNTSSSIIDNKEVKGHTYKYHSTYIKVERGTVDKDSTPGNRVRGEDDMGQADLIIGVKTGAVISYIMITLSIIIVIGIAGYLISKKVLSKEIKFE